MADEATERFLENAIRISWLFIKFSSMYIVFTESIEINGSIVRFVPVGFEDFPEVFGWALILKLTAYMLFGWIIREMLRSLQLVQFGKM